MLLSDRTPGPAPSTRTCPRLPSPRVLLVCTQSLLHKSPALVDGAEAVRLLLGDGRPRVVATLLRRVAAGHAAGVIIAALGALERGRLAAIAITSSRLAELGSIPTERQAEPRLARDGVELNRACLGHGMLPLFLAVP